MNAQDSDFQPFHWAWPGKYQPLHALMVLIREVERNPADANSKLFREVVDEALALCGPNGSGLTYSDGPNLAVRNLTEGGSEAWDFIRALRRHAWVRAGADPDVMFTREEVFERVLERGRTNRVGFIEEDEERARLMDAEERERGIAVREGRILPPVSSAEEALIEADERHAEHIVEHPGPTPNMNWNEWETMFAGQHGDDESFMFG